MYRNRIAFLDKCLEEKIIPHKIFSKDPIHSLA